MCPSGFRPGRFGLRRVAALLACVPALGCGRPEVPVIVSSAGEAVVLDETVVTGSPLTRTVVVRLRKPGTRGFDLHVREPKAGQKGLPAYLLLVGLETGRESLDLVEERDDIVVASMNYPYEGPWPLRGFRLPLALPALQQMAEDTLRHTSSALDYLAGRDDVDPGQVIIVGVSFGSVFAAALGAHDPRPTAVVLVYAGGNLPAIVKNLPRPWWIPGFLVGPVVKTLFGDLDPLQHVAAIAPRPLLMVNSRKDEMVTPALAEALYRKAAQPKKIVWYETGHLELFEPVLVRQIVSDVIGELEAMGAVGKPSASESREAPAPK